MLSEHSEGSIINGDFPSTPPSSGARVDLSVKVASTLYFPLFVIWKMVLFTS